MGFRRLVRVCAAVWAVLLPAVASAHRLPPEVVAFFKADGPRLHVLVRVPTAMLGDARLPVVETVYLDLRNINDRLRAIGAEVTRSLDITDYGRPIAPGPVTWIVSPFDDHSFDSYEGAVQRLSGPPIPLDRYVYWNEAFVDLQVDYAVASDSPGLSARLNGLRLGGDFFQTRATYVPSEGPVRTFIVAGSPQRVVFEPPAADAVTGFLGRAIPVVLGERLLALFIFCLAVPRRSTAAFLRQFAAFAMPHAVAAACVLAMFSPPVEATQDVAQVIAAAALVLTAVQNVANSSVVSRAIGAATFGVASGITLGSNVHGAWPLAGSHAPVALGVFLVLVAIGSAAALMLVQPLLRIPFSWRAPAWLTMAALSAVPAHEAMHAAGEAMARLRGQDLEVAGPITRFAVNGWPVLTLVMLLVVMLTWSILARRSAWSVSDAGSAL
jgi:hypothetical protein